MDDDEEEEEQRFRSPLGSKRGSEILRILKDQGSPLADEIGERKQQKVLNGEYRLLEVIGEGSFGTVYEAKCNRTGKVVAIKKFKNKY